MARVGDGQESGKFDKLIKEHLVDSAQDVVDPNKAEGTDIRADDF